MCVVYACESACLCLHVLVLLRACGADVIVGSDLIYCASVVLPLLQTVASYLASEGVFVLVSSFDIGEESNALFAASATQLGLVDREVQGLSWHGPDDPYPTTHRIQYLTRTIG